MPENELPAIKRAGRQLVNLVEGAEVIVVTEATGDHAAVIGENRKLLVFPLEEIPEMNRGKGVRLLGGKGGEISDVTVFVAEEGLTWTDGAGRRHPVEDWKLFLGKRAQAGRLAPKGFSRSGRFGPRGQV